MLECRAPPPCGQLTRCFSTVAELLVLFLEGNVANICNEMKAEHLPCGANVETVTAQLLVAVRLQLFCFLHSTHIGLDQMSHMALKGHQTPDEQTLNGERCCTMVQHQTDVPLRNYSLTVCSTEVAISAK